MCPRGPRFFTAHSPVSPPHPRARPAAALARLEKQPASVRAARDAIRELGRIAGYIEDIVKALDSVTCEGVSTNPNRRLFALDPWGQPYWIYYERSADKTSGTALFYSFGPNRRYDSPQGSIEGTDDIGTRSRPLSRDTHLPE